MKIRLIPMKIQEKILLAHARGKITFQEALAILEEAILRDDIMKGAKNEMQVFGTQKQK